MGDLLGPNPGAVLFLVGVALAVVASLIYVLRPARFRFLGRGVLVFIGLSNLALLVIKPIFPLLQGLAAAIPLALLVPGATGSGLLMLLAVAFVAGGIVGGVSVELLVAGPLFILMIAGAKLWWGIEI